MDLEQECVEEFLDLARELQVRGLAGEKREEPATTTTMVPVKNEEAQDSFYEEDTEKFADETDDVIRDIEELLGEKKAEVQAEMEIVNTKEDAVDVKAVTTTNEHISNEKYDILGTTKVDGETLTTSAVKSRKTKLLKNIKCEQCGQEFKGIRKMKKHVKELHWKDDSYEKSETEEDRNLSTDLPPGWKRIVHQRTNSKAEHKVDYIIVTEEGLRLKSQVQVDNYLRYNKVGWQVRIKPGFIGEVNNFKSKKSYIWTPLIIMFFCQGFHLQETKQFYFLIYLHLLIILLQTGMMN